MIAGFVDGRGRAYDAGFRTLRLSLTDAEGVLVTASGEEIRVQESATVAIDLLGSKPVPFLRPVRGDLIATPARIVFLVAPGVSRRDPFTFYNVSVQLHPSAIEHFFTVQGGREFLQFTRDDVKSSSPSRAGLEVVLHGSAPGKPGEPAQYRLRVEPRTAGERALAALG